MGAALALAALVALAGGCAEDEDEGMAVLDGEEALSGSTDCAPADALDPATACATLTMPGEPRARIVWVTYPDEEVHIDGEVALDWAFQYAVRVPPEAWAQYTVEQERCRPPAPHGVSCDVLSLRPPSEECAVVYTPRFGLDSSQYRPGINEHTFKLRLIRGGAVVSEDKFTLTLVVRP